MHIQERPNVLRIIFIKLFELVNIGIIDTAQHTQRRIVIIVLYKFRRQEMGERGRFGTPAGSVIQGEKEQIQTLLQERVGHRTLNPHLHLSVVK